MRMRNITIMGLFTVLLAASFSARSPDREAARDPEVGGVDEGRDSPDTPITISDGSPLMLRSVLPWVEYDDNEISPDDVHRTVTNISIMVNKGSLKPFVFKNQRCEVDITYGKITLTLKTNRLGRGLRVSTSEGTFGKYWKLEGPYTYSINMPGARITRVTIKQPFTRVLDLAAGPKTITIHYVKPVVK